MSVRAVTCWSGRLQATNMKRTQVQLHKPAAIVDQAGGNAPGELDAICREGVEGAACQLAQTALQGGQRGDQRPSQPRVAVQVQVA